MLLRIKFRTKNSLGTHIYFLQKWSYGVRKIDMSQIYCTEIEK